MADTKNGYIGKIKNSGSQVVKAPFTAESGPKGVVHKGTDLREGTSKGAKK